MGPESPVPVLLFAAAEYVTDRRKVRKVQGDYPQPEIIPQNFWIIHQVLVDRRELLIYDVYTPNGGEAWVKGLIIPNAIV